MIPLGEAQRRVLDRCRPLGAIRLPLDDAFGHVLARSVLASESVPPFANTAMDGYAVRAADLSGATSARPARLRVIGTLAAGQDPSVKVGPGEALRIMTGAPFPEGADTVAIVELTTSDGDTVAITEPVAAGQFIRAAGEDIRPGQRIARAGDRLEPTRLGVLASVGVTEVDVIRRPRVGVLVTGDELVEASAPLRRGQVHDSNRHSLLATVRADGFSPVDLGIASDDRDLLRTRLQEAAGSCDAVLTSGGVSMGDFDYVKVVLGELGELDWMQIGIRPAKPFAFALVAGTPIFGLPGNPVSSLISYELLARPALRLLAGYGPDELRRRSWRGVADTDLRPSPDGRVNYVRVRADFGDDGRCHVEALGGQGSHQLAALADANALAVVPAGPGIGPGDEVDVLWLGDPARGGTDEGGDSFRIAPR